MLSKTVLCCALAAAPAMAYVPGNVGGVLKLKAQSDGVSRRAFLGLGAAAGAALIAPQDAEAVKAKTGLSSVFTGQYDDPKHLGCDREIKVTGAPLDSAGRRSRNKVAVVTGADGNPACTDLPEADQKKWKLTGTVAENDKTVLIDFSSKGGPKDLLGKWDGDGITFPDGNKWTKKKEVVAKKEAYVWRPTSARVQAPEPTEESE